MTPRLIQVARGEQPADLLIAGGRIVNVFTAQVETANVAIYLENGKGTIAGVGDYTAAKQTVQLDNAYIAPGFIDAHMHVESTMLPPSEFIMLAAPHATTGVIL